MESATTAGGSCVTQTVLESTCSPLQRSRLVRKEVNSQHSTVAGATVDQQDDDDDVVAVVVVVAVHHVQYLCASKFCGFNQYS